MLAPMILIRIMVYVVILHTTMDAYSVSGQSIVNTAEKSYYFSWNMSHFEDVVEQCAALDLPALRLANNAEFLEFADILSVTGIIELHNFWVFAEKISYENATYTWLDEVVNSSFIDHSNTSLEDPLNCRCLRTKPHTDGVRLKENCCIIHRGYVCDMSSYCPNRLFHAQQRNDSFYCTVNAVPNVTIANDALSVGGNTQLTCEVTLLAEGIVSRDQIEGYTWFKDDAPVHGYEYLGYSLLELTSVTYADQGNYTCRFVTGGMESNTSQAKFLSVNSPQPPTLYTNLLDLDIMLGQQVSLYCEAKDYNSGLRYSFYTPLGQEIVTEEHSFHIEEFSTADIGEYKCRVLILDTPSEDSNPVLLNLKPRQPAITSEKTNLAFGESTVLYCSSMDNVTQDVKYKWLLNDSKFYRASEDVSTINDFARDKEGFYACQIRISKVWSEKSAPIWLSYAWTPTNLTADNTEIRAGSNVTLSCSSLEPGTKVYQFFHNGQSLRTESSIPNPNQTDVSVYEIRNFTNDDAGQYLCSVNVDGTSSPNSREITLFLISSPILTSSATTVPEKSSIQLRCTPNQSDVLSFSWAKDGTIFSTTVSDYISIKSFMKVDQGNYTCGINRGDNVPDHMTSWSNIVTLVLVGQFHRCECKCSDSAVRVNMTNEEKDASVQSLQGQLRIVSSDLTATQRKKISASDQRATSVTGGVFAVTLLFVVSLAIILSDVIYYWKCCLGFRCTKI